MHEEYAEKSWARVDKTGPDDCWLWVGSRLPKGYGRFYPKWKINGKRCGFNAHRISWEIKNNRPVPEGLDVLHTCDNPPCVNPAHLFPGTKSDNMQDMLRKGRGGYTGSPGEAHPSAKLVESDVLEIRHRWDAGGIRQRDLAAEYGVSRGLIGQIVRRESWSHL